jgi:hypothetical protein
MTITIALITAFIAASAWKAWCIWKLAKESFNNK